MASRLLIIKHAVACILEPMNCLLVSMMLIPIVIALILHSAASTHANEYYGNNFYLGAMKNYEADTTRLWLTVSTNHTSNVSFTVETLYYTVSNNVSLYQPTSVELPLDLVVEEYSYLHRAKGIHVFTHDQTLNVAVALFNWEFGSVGDYLSLPCSPLPRSSMWQLQQIDEQFVYFTVSTQSVVQQPYVWSQALLVACEDNTLISVIPSQEMLIPINPQDSYSPAVTVFPGQEHKFTLNAGQTLFLGNPTSDITGTEIISSEPLTVVSGHECSNVPQDIQWCEHLTEQIPPTYTWGNEFLLVPFEGRPSGQYFKVVAKHDSTMISVVCNPDNHTAIIKNIELHIEFRGGYSSFFIESSNYCHLISTKPILLVQLALGAERDDVGDPIMTIHPPTQQYATSLHFDVLDRESFAKSYVNIVTKGDIANVTFDGAPLNNTVKWVAILDSSSNVAGYGCKMEVEPGVHTLDHQSEVGLSAILYGFHTLPFRGYGHMLGSQLKLLSEMLFVSFEKQEYSVQENNANINVRIHCSATFSANASVIVKTIPSDADRNDFEPVNEVVTCKQGESYKDITIFITDDVVVEPVETFIVSLETLSEEFNSQYNRTIVTIIDNDSIEVGLTGELQSSVDSNQLKATVTVGLAKGMLQEDAIVDLTVHLHLMKNASLIRRAVYQATLTYLVSTIRAEFNLTRIMESSLLMENDHYEVVGTLSAEQSTVLVDLSDFSLNMSLPIISSRASSLESFTGNTSSTLISTNTKYSTSTSVQVTEASLVLSQCIPAVTTITTTSTAGVLITSGLPAETVQPLMSSFAVITLSSAGGIFILIIAIVIAVCVLALMKSAKKSSSANNQQGVTNPYQIPPTTAPADSYNNTVKS